MTLNHSPNLSSKQLSLLLKALAFSVLMFGLMGGAFAQAIIDAPNNKSTWTVYAFGNAQAVSDTFRALANFAASGTFRSLVTMIAVIGVVVVGASSGFNGQMARKFVGYIMGVMLTVYVLFGFTNNGTLTVRVEVQDIVDGTWKAPVNVPAVVGIPASLISVAGFEITKQLEASFPLPQGLKMSNGAPFNLAAALVNDATKAKITDSNLSSSMAMYVQDCFIPSVARGEKDAQTLLVSTDFLKDLEVKNVSLLVNTFLGATAADAGGAPALVSCTDAYARIKSVVDADSSASAYLTSASAWAGTSALSVVNSAADTVAQWAQTGEAAGGATGGGTFVKQAAVLASFTGAFRQTASQTGNSDFLTGLAVTQATEGQKNSWIVGAEVFNRMMGYIFAILQVFVYGITPLILAASLVPSLGAALLKNFMQILLWLAIWQPMLAIVNFIITSMQWSDLNGVLGGKQNFGMSLSGMPIVSEKTANMRAAATFVGTMVPALAWAMVKGSLDFSRIIGSAVGESFAQGASNTMTSGNFSLNNGSMDSFTANKNSVGQTFDAGKGFSLAGNGGINNKNDLGGNFNPSSGDNSAGVQTRADYNTGSSATNGRQAGQGGQSANTVAGGNSAGVTTTSSDGVTGSHTDNSGRSTSINANGQLQAGVQILKPGTQGQAGGAAGAGGAGVGGSGAEQPGANDRVAQSRRTFNSPITAGGSVSIGTGVQATQGSTDTQNRSVSRVDGANRGRTGQDTTTTSDTASDMRTAGRSEQGTRGQGMSVTTLAPSAEQAAVHSQALNFSNGRFGREGTEGSVGASLFYNKAPTTDIGRAAEEVSTSGAVVSKVEGQEKKADTDMAKYGKEEERLAAEAKARSAAANKAANGQIETDGKKVEGMRNAALVSPSERAGKEVAEVADKFMNSTPVQAASLAFGDAKESLGQFRDNVSQMVGNAGGKVADAAKGAGAYASDKVEQARQALGGEPRHEAGQQRPVNGTQQPAAPDSNGAPQQVVVVQQNVTGGNTPAAHRQAEPATQGQHGHQADRSDGKPQEPSQGIQLTQGDKPAPARAAAAPSAPRSSTSGGSSGRPDASDDGPAGMPSQTTGSSRPPSR